MSEPVFAHDLADGCTLAVRVHPGAKKNGVTGINAGAVKISLTSGATSRTKLLRITGKSAAELQAALSPIIAC